MIIPDVNVLVHAHNSDSPIHDRVRMWWDDSLSGTTGIGLPWVTLLGFVRICTHRKILMRPLPIADVMNLVESWLAMPHVHIPHPSDRHFDGIRQAFEALGTAGNLTTDAHLATLAIQRGYILYSTDTDFARFPGLRWVNPAFE